MIREKLEELEKFYYHWYNHEDNIYFDTNRRFLRISEKLFEFLDELLDTIEHPKKNNPRPLKQHIVPEGYILLDKWNEDPTRLKWISVHGVGNIISSSVERHKFCKKIGRKWAVNPVELWEFVWNSPTAIFSRLKVKQKEHAQEWKEHYGKWPRQISC